MKITDQARRLGETLLVLCVSILLINIFLSGTEQATQSARDSYQKSQVATIAGALQTYYLDQGAYPETPNRLPFCKPFDPYDNGRCLGELVGPYLQSDSVYQGTGEFVYVNSSKSGVFIAADIAIDNAEEKNNSCRVGAIDFWCIKLTP